MTAVHQHVMLSESEASGLTNRAAWPTQMLRSRSA